ncbi:MAG TPA: glycosyltransferase [Aggregatilineales bacterium]|nr:glycosyltransferase [Aggregatilineales bacterium]
MHIGILLPGFSQDERDPAIPVQLNLVRELARRDSVRVLALRYPFERRIYTVAGAEVHALGAGPVRGLHRLKLWADALIHLRQMHRTQPFDLLHAMWADETGLIAAWAARMLRVPVVISVAGGETVWLPDIQYGLQGSAFSRWTVRQALNGADRIVVASRYSQRLIENIIGTGKVSSAGKMAYIPLGVDAAHFRPDPSSGSNHGKLIHVASLIGVKDQATLLSAMTHLPDHITLGIIGEGPESARLELLTAALGIQHRVQFAGAVPHQELPKHYQRASLHVLTSRHEGQGMVTLEAAACGLPTVSTAVGIVPDDPDLGVYVSVGDDAALAGAITALLQNTEQLRARSRNARTAVEARYTIQHTVTQLRDLYRDLTSQSTEASFIPANH